MRSPAALRRCLIAAAIAPFAVALGPVPAAPAAPYEGQLKIRHSDDFATGRTATRYTLRESRSKRYTIRPALPPNIMSGSNVVVRGTRSGSVIRGAIAARPGVRAASAGVLGNYKIAVLLVNFSDDLREPWTPSAVQDRFFGAAADTIDSYYKEQSWNQVDLSGAVYGWYHLAQTHAGCDFDAWATAADQQATTAGVPLATFDSIAYVFPSQTDCGWAGLAELPGRHLWLNGDISVRVAAHELGHNMGVHHAAALSCSNGATAVAISSTCSMSEYGDPFSTMGSATRRMAGWHLQQLGYLSPANVQSITTSGTYTLRTSLNSTGDPVLLKIPRTPAASPAEYYYLDLRTAGGAFDNFGITDPAIKGVTIRVGNAPTVRNQSKLIDTTPDSYSNPAQDFIDAPLQPGRTFSDGTVSITTLSVAGGAATVQVGWNGTGPDTEPPSAPAITNAMYYGSYVDLSWTPSTDNVGLAGYRIKRGGQTVATLGPAETTYRDNTTSMSPYCIEAFDAAGNTRPSTCATPMRYVPPTTTTSTPTTQPPTSTGTGAGTTTPPVDVTAPALKLVSPGSNASLRKKATVRATATDGVGVTVTELWVDNVKLASKRGGTLSVTWNLKRVRAGKHKVMVLARDAAGNTAKRTVTVRVRR